MMVNKNIQNNRLKIIFQSSIIAAFCFAFIESYKIIINSRIRYLRSWDVITITIALFIAYSILWFGLNSCIAFIYGLLSRIRKISKDVSIIGYVCISLFLYQIFWILYKNFSNRQIYSIQGLYQSLTRIIFAALISFGVFIIVDKLYKKQCLKQIGLKLFSFGISVLVYMFLYVYIRSTNYQGFIHPLYIIALVVPGFIIYISLYYLIKWIIPVFRRLSEMIKVILIVISFLSFIFYFVIRGFSNEIAGNSKFNILLISIDTLRADHVSIYNQIDRETTPNIDKIAKVSHVFKRAYSQSSWTLPGHASMLTGLFPSSHQAMRSLKQTITRPIDPLPSSVLTLAEVLKSEGYNTAGIISNPFVSSAFGMDQGFNFFDDQLDLFKNVKYIAIKDFAMLFQIFKIFKLIDGNDYDGERHVFEVNPKALKWLEMNRNEKKPFFLFLHYNEPHYIYEPPYPYNKDDNGKPIEYFMDIDRLSHGQYSLSSRGLKDLLSLYDGEISYLDNQLGELFGKIEQWNLMEKTVIIITSDHGESFNEHEIWQHGNSLYEEQIHVPMIIYCPDLIPKGVIDNKHIVQLVDLMPTILDMLEIPIPTNIQGRSLLPIFKGKPNVQFDLAFAEIRPDVKWKVSNPRYGEGMKAVIKNEWKYILNDNGNEELYNIHIDPSEEKNLIFHQNEKISKMRDIMNVWTSAVNIQQKSKKQEIDRGRLEQLRSLGYVQ